MRYEGVSAKGERVVLHYPVEIKLQMDEEAPAHGFTGVFLYEPDLPEFLYFNIYESDGTLLFGGIVDSQCNQIQTKGALLTITARSKAALLLDNEANPKTYVNPSLGQLFADYGSPFGLQKFVGKTSSFYWTYVISKGVSAWQVFSDFCIYCLGITPKVTPDGILDATGVQPSETLYFSNVDGIRYSTLTENRYPCKQISQLWMQNALGDGYTNHVVDLATIRQGIQRTRYITAADWQGRLKLKSARRKSRELVLICPGRIQSDLGMRATVSDKQFGAFTNFSVAKISYTLNDQGEKTAITLRTDL